jgi:hypothetical protein
VVLRLSNEGILQRVEASRSSLASVGSTGAGTGRRGAFKLENATPRIGAQEQPSSCKSTTKLSPESCGDPGRFAASNRRDARQTGAGYSRIHGRITRRTGALTVATTIGSISFRRRRCRNAACTVDFERPVFAETVCKLTETASRRAFAACRSRNRYTMNVAGRRSCPTRSGIRTSTT